MTEPLPGEKPLTFAEESKPSDSLNAAILDSWQQIARDQGAEALYNTPLLIHISGMSSGVGKQTVINDMLEYWAANKDLKGNSIEVRVAKSATTRPIRSEADYSQYELLRYQDGEDVGQVEAEKRFLELVEAGVILEANPFNGNWYGKMLTNADLRHPGITIIESETHGLMNLKHGGTVSAPQGREIVVAPIPNLVSINLIPPGDSWPSMRDVLAQRMRSRGDDETVIKERLYDSTAIPEEIGRILFTAEVPIDHLIVSQPHNEYKENDPSWGAISISGNYWQAKQSIYQDFWAYQNQSTQLGH